MTTKDKVCAAFKRLRQHGYMTRMNYMCCSNCGHSALMDEQEARAHDPKRQRRGYVFWCSQSNDAWEKRELVAPLYLQWSADDDRSTEIVQALRAAGLKVSHRGGTKQCIRLAATRRRSPERIAQDHEMKRFYAQLRAERTRTLAPRVN